MRTKLIIFSKDRTLQLKSLLLSIRANYNIAEENIFIIYKSSSPHITYNPLINQFKCNFIRQNDFLQDIKNAIDINKCDYIQFMVDDLIVNKKVDLSTIEKFMDEHHDITAFSFRLGKNIITSPKPTFTEYEHNIISWNTSSRLGSHWNYAWDVSSSMYRLDYVNSYITKCRHDKESFPNPFEDHYYQVMPNTKKQSFPFNIINTIRFLTKQKSVKLASFSESKCFTQGVNLVADIGDNSRKESFNPVILHQKMLNGFIIDYESLQNLLPETPNAGDKYFKLKKIN